jgi:hypothetical protein
MKHFTLAEWADFVRHLTDPAVTATMQWHLDEGCEACTKVVRVWRGLLDFGSKEKLFSPPDRVLRSVVGYYRLFRDWKVESPAARVASLVFDSLLEPIPVGIRSSQASPRRMLYFAGDFVIDLRLEQKAHQLRLVGQAERQGSRLVSGMRVLVQKADETVAQTRCNRYGEFQVDVRLKEIDELSVVLRRNNFALIIPLHPNRSREGRRL